MSTSDTNNRLRPMRAVIGYTGLAVMCIGIANTYALFGHGVRSAAMDWMFLYPLAGGGIFLLLRILRPDLGDRPLYRLASNLMGSGVAALTAGAMLQGILEVAGTASGYLLLFFLAGWVMVAVSLVLFAILVIAK